MNISVIVFIFYSFKLTFSFYSLLLFCGLVVVPFIDGDDGDGGNGSSYVSGGVYLFICRCCFCIHLYIFNFVVFFHHYELRTYIYNGPFQMNISFESHCFHQFAVTSTDAYILLT